MSKSLRLLMINERIANFFERIAHQLFRSQKTNDSCDSLIPSMLMSNVRESLRSLTKNQRCEGIAQVAHQNRATLSDLLRWLTKMSESLNFFSESLICLLFVNFFAKTRNLLRKLMSEFPTLKLCDVCVYSTVNIVHHSAERALSFLFWLSSRVWNSLFHSSVFCSKWLFLKSICE